MKNRIKKFTESIETKKFQEVTDEVKSLIEKTVEKGGDFKSFVESYIKNPTDVKIEGLIDESDIFDFYLKYRNQIDELLQEVNFYDESPNVIRLYDYIISGTMSAVLEIVKSLPDQ